MEAQTLLLVIAAIAVMVLAVALVAQKNKITNALNSFDIDKMALEDRV